MKAFFPLYTSSLHSDFDWVLVVMFQNIFSHISFFFEEGKNQVNGLWIRFWITVSWISQREKKTYACALQHLSCFIRRFWWAKLKHNSNKILKSFVEVGYPPCIISPTLVSYPTYVAGKYTIVKTYFKRMFSFWTCIYYNILSFLTRWKKILTKRNNWFLTIFLILLFWIYKLLYLKKGWNLLPFKYIQKP